MKREHLLIAATLLVGPAAGANVSIPFQTAAFNMVSLFWGDQEAQDEAKTCTQTYRQNGSGNDLNGQIGAVNQFFCEIEKTIGLTGPTTGKTGSYSMFTWTNYVHAVVTGTAGGGTFNGYDFQGQIWVCATGGGTDCSQTSQYYPAAFLTWSYKSDHSVDKGTLIEDDDVLHGGDGTGTNSRPTYMTWDLGTNSSPRIASVLQVVYGGGSTYSNYYGETVFNGTEQTESVIFSPSGGAGECTGGSFASNTDTSCSTPTFRYLVTANTATNQAAVSFQAFFTGNSDENEFNTTGDPTTLSSAAPDTLICANRTATSTDWSYSEDFSNSCSVLPAVTFPVGMSAKTVGLQTPSSLTAYWNSMPTHPSSL
jgi:hypothetical protein